MSVEEPITNIETAKNYFQSMGCSHFHMCREIPKRYSEYQGLNIPESKENEWTLEEISSALLRLKCDDTPREDLWAIHSGVATLVLARKFHEQLEPLLLATSAISYAIKSQREQLLVAETIVGRQDVSYRAGLIFRCHSISRYDLAARYVELVERLVAKPFSAPTEEQRRLSLLLALEKTTAACDIKHS